MSIRTALARFIAPRDVVVISKTEEPAIPKLAKLSPEDLRGLLLQLLPDPVSGRPGPVQIMTPFETEEIVRKEMFRLNEALTDALKLVSDTADRLAVFEMSEKGKLVIELERLRPRVAALENALHGVLFVLDSFEIADGLILQYRDKAIAAAEKALVGTALE
jgi:hypothetical protein